MLAHSLRSLRPVRSARGISTISPAALTQIETRWGKLPEAEQGAIADKLAAAQKGDWKSLTLDEKRAGMECSIRAGEA
ncbi:hypothetical protein HK101_005246 [Irineochytrium annulatum]|nr:hypothetical protein HK101_005246 [Irineochytrium annulatum]